LDRKEILSLIRKLMDEKKNVSKKIEGIQEGCIHKDGYDVKFIGQSNEVRRVCKTCQKIIGYPSEQELKDNGFI
jgi:hypothetical protein